MRVRSAICVVAIALVSSAATAQQWMNDDFGGSERSWNVKSKPPLDVILFAWEPALSPRDTTLYFLGGQCDQLNDSGEPKGKNRIAFVNVVLAGVDTETTVFLPDQRKDLKKGRGEMAVWDLTPHMFNFSADTLVLPGSAIFASKKVRGLHSLVVS